MLPLSTHAITAMKRRQIPEHVVMMIYEHPTQKIPLANGREIWQNTVCMDGKEYVVRLIVEPEPTPTIVTVYRSSKIEKYWRAL